MYAAAGGASLASRQARQRQRQQKKTQLLQAKLHPPKASGLSVAEHGASTPTRQSRQFHQLPTTYLRAPQGQVRKFSTGYTAQSKFLLPIDEGDTQSVLQMRMHSHTHTHLQNLHAHSHSHQHQQHFAHYTNSQQQRECSAISPKLVHRHSGSSGTSYHHSHLTRSATAALPFVLQVQATPPATPSVAATKASDVELATTADQEPATDLVHHDTIIVTPATPMTSPGHVRRVYENLSESFTEEQPLTAADAGDDEEQMQPPVKSLERKCSVYRMRRSDAFELGAVDIGVKRQLKEIQFNQQLYEPLLADEPNSIFKGYASGGRKLQMCAYCEEGICFCEHIECAQGRAAWLERGRRCSVQDSQLQPACHRRWVKRNRVQDASLGGSSDDVDFLGVLRGPSTFANAFLYVGLGTIALGLVIAFVGTGEKGFKTVELRFIGPSLIGLGFICCTLRILFCICPSHCITSDNNVSKKKVNRVDADHTTSLLRGENKRVSITRGSNQRAYAKYPITHKRSNSKMLNEGMEALRQIATTSLFMQNEQKPLTNRIIPTIKEPEQDVEAAHETRNLDTSQSVCENSADGADKCEKDNEQEITNIGLLDEHVQTDITSTAVIASLQTFVIDGTMVSTSVTPATEMTPLRVSDSNSKLSRQRIALHQQYPLEQHSLISETNEFVSTGCQMETSLICTQKPDLENKMCPSTLATTVSSTHLLELSPPPTPIHVTNYPRNQIMSTYSAANESLFGINNSHTSATERTESVIRGPLGTSTVTTPSGLPASVPAVSSTEEITSPAPVLHQQIARSANSNQQSITDQIEIEKTSISLNTKDSNSKGSEEGTVDIKSSLVSSPNIKNSVPTQMQLHPSASINFKCPTLLPSSSYSDDSATLSHADSSIVIDSMFALSATPTTCKYEPELLLSPAKLGQ